VTDWPCQVVRTPAGWRDSAVWIGADLLADPPPEVLHWLAGRRAFVVSSQPVRRLHGARMAALEAAAGSVEWLDVPDGEAAKDLATVGRLWNALLAAGGKRDSLVVAFGGGSVGDVTGFAAGAFLRGIEFLQVPTTLLAQVDASVGGKTGIDLPAGKNTVGLFHPPAHVLADTSLLTTLPRAELRSGLVEVVKMAAVLDGELLTRCERDLGSLLAGDVATLTPVVESAVAAKVRVVGEDPTETTGRRRVLNLGHTLGHAIETVLEYGHLRHGEAVAYGLLFAIRLAQRLRLIEDDVGERLRRLLGRFELPVLPVDRLPVAALLAAMARDKKASQRGLVWVLPRRVGEDRQEPVPAELVREELEPFLADPWADAA
jgi:3-dehydroquinate synthase